MIYNLKDYDKSAVLRSWGILLEEKREHSRFPLDRAVLLCSLWIMSEWSMEEIQNMYELNVDKIWRYRIKVNVARIPTRTGKPGKIGRHFPAREKVREFWTDWKSQEKSHKILENSGNFRQKLFVIFQWYLNELCIIC